MGNSSFAFLAPHGPLYLKLAVVAENALTLDPTLTLLKLRQLGEAFARHAAAQAGLLSSHHQESQLDVLRVLEQRGIVREQIAELFHAIRRVGNRAAHDFVGTHQEALDSLRLAYRLACWFHLMFSDATVRATFKPAVYVPPADPTAKLRQLQEEAAKAKLEAAQHRLDADRAKEALDAEVARRTEEERLRREAESERAEWEQLANAFEDDLRKAATEQAKVVDAVVLERSAAPPAKVEQAAVAQAILATAATQLTEADTRLLIDAQLREAGWEVDTQLLRWPAGARPEKGRNRVISEVPTWSESDGDGLADYVLFVGLVPYAIVEAKKQSKNIPASIEQGKRYARGLDVQPAIESATHASEGAPMEWGWRTSSQAGSTARYRVPFIYATNGRPYLRQLETESGVWFLDARKPTNHPRALTGWHTPDVLVSMVKLDPEDAQRRLATDPPDSLQETLGLRNYQINAIRCVEDAIGHGQRNLLVAMATGTGKTRTIIGLIHRLLRSQRFRRVLFLVDRGALGKQATDAFAEVRLENLQTFAQNYDVMGFEEIQSSNESAARRGRGRLRSSKTPERETKVHIATVQGLARRILWPSSDDEVVPIDRYDCIIVDESHRGYTLDREMTEGEMELRNQDDYISAYRRVLDHFDAVKIGLTATPAAHTREIFGDAVFTYSYPEAVADGFLVDHEPPIQITTQLARDGIKFDKGAEVEVLRPGGQLELSLLPDEMSYDVAEFNRNVVTDGFNRAVASALAEKLDPFDRAKTIVFCVDDDHADRFVVILKEALASAWGAIDDNVVQKITGQTDKPLEAIKRFKNELAPNIAVTVDLLSTGIDVPEVANIVFMRRIKSRILYDQMLGRATRLCPEIGKEVFRIYDAVGLYETLSPVSQMRPLVKDVHRTPKELLDELLDPRSSTAPGSTPERSHADEVHREIVEKLRRLVRRIGKQKMTPERQNLIELVEAAMGCAIDQVPDVLHTLGTEASIARIRSAPDVVTILDRLAADPGLAEGKAIAPHADTVVAVEHGYGPGNERPEDYLQAFSAFVAQNRNLIAALTVVCTRPRDLTRAELKDLKLKLDAAGYSEAKLRTAWRSWKNEDIAATIIGFIRQQALGSPLIPYEQRVDVALAKLLVAPTWTTPQRTWLKRIAEQLKKEVVVDEAAFSTGAFANAGGWKAIDKVLGGRLKEVLETLGDEVWNDNQVA